jgi:uncharacterized protein YcbX
MMPAGPATVTGLVVYPVKSMRGIPLTTARLAPEGLEHDRRFMVVRPDGRFVTQRDAPRLALIETRLDAAGVTLSAADAGQVFVPFDAGGGAPLTVRIWGQECAAVDQGPVVAQWLGEALQSPDPLRLVGMAPGFVRPQGKPRELGAGTHTVFADAAPYLVTTEASLDALNAALAGAGRDPAPMNRFRPNVVLAGLGPFGEHAVQRASGPGYAFRFAHPCQRCLVTTVDQATGERDPEREPYRTLAQLNPMPGKPDAPAFGQNASLDEGAGALIRLGDELQLEGLST